MASGKKDMPEVFDVSAYYPVSHAEPKTSFKRVPITKPPPVASSTLPDSTPLTEFGLPVNPEDCEIHDDDIPRGYARGEVPPDIIEHTFRAAWDFYSTTLKPLKKERDSYIAEKKDIYSRHPDDDDLLSNPEHIDDRTRLFYINGMFEKVSKTINQYIAYSFPGLAYHTPRFIETIVKSGWKEDLIMSILKNYKEHFTGEKFSDKEVKERAYSYLIEQAKLKGEVKTKKT